MPGTRAAANISPNLSWYEVCCNLSRLNGTCLSIGLVAHNYIAVDCCLARKAVRGGGAGKGLLLGSRARRDLPADELNFACATLAIAVAIPQLAWV